MHGVLVCPKCHCELIKAKGSFTCEKCRHNFSANEYGYYEFILKKASLQVDAYTDEYAHSQILGGPRFVKEFLHPLILQEHVERILEVGAGVGKSISAVSQMGYEAYGIDLPSLSPFWAKAARDPHVFLSSDATQMPFRNDYFDFVFSLGVIEHIGTVMGHCTLADDFWEVRQEYANEIVRITKPGGRIVISCPNKSFPIDIQHGPTDDITPKSKVNRLREIIYEKFKINLHPVWGKQHLLSYSEVNELFRVAGVQSFDPLPLRGYFGFSTFESGYLKYVRPVAEAYINKLPAFLRSTFFNPYLFVQMRK